MRIKGQVPGFLVAGRSGIDPARLSRIERGQLPGTPEELQKIETELVRLIEARKEVVATAERVGWPL